jgi:hypothetical protein
MRLSAGPAASVVDARTEMVWLASTIRRRRRPAEPGQESNDQRAATAASIRSRACRSGLRSGHSPRTARAARAAVTNCCHPVFSTITSLFNTLSHAGRGVRRSRHLARVIAGRFLRHAAVLARVVGTWRAARG